MSNGTVCIQLALLIIIIIWSFSQEIHLIPPLLRFCFHLFGMAFILIQVLKFSLIENSSTVSWKFMALKNAVIVQNYFVYDLRFINLLVHKTLDTMAMATWRTYFRSHAHINVWSLSTTIFGLLGFAVHQILSKQPTKIKKLHDFFVN